MSLIKQKIEDMIKIKMKRNNSKASMNDSLSLTEQFDACLGNPGKFSLTTLN